MARGQAVRAVRAHAELKVTAPLVASAGEGGAGTERNAGQFCREAPAPGWRLAHVRAAPPIAFRATPEAVYLVGTAAFPAGEDIVTVEVEVGAGAVLPVRSAASMIAWASNGSSLDMELKVRAESTLDWQLKPLIATAGCSFSQRVRARMEPGARLLWVEEVVLGRHGELPGRLDLRLDVDATGPLLRHQLAVGSGVLGWDGPAVIGGSRAMGIVLLAGAGLARKVTDPPTHQAGKGWAIMALEGPGVLATAVGRDLGEVRVLMDEAFAGWAEIAGPGSPHIRRANGSVGVDWPTGADQTCSPF